MLRRNLRRQWNFAKIAAREHRRIHELVQWDSSEVGGRAVCASRCQRGGELPASGQHDAGRDLHILGGRHLRPQHHFIPTDHREIFAGGGAGGKANRTGGRQKIIVHMQLRYALRHMDVKLEHIDTVAHPGQRSGRWP